jgi:hypothetical protein
MMLFRTSLIIDGKVKSRCRNLECQNVQTGPWRLWHSDTMVSPRSAFQIAAVFATGVLAGSFLSSAAEIARSFTAPSPVAEAPPLPAAPQPIDSRPVRLIPILPPAAETSGAARSEPAKKDTASDSKTSKRPPKCDRRACSRYRSFDASTCTYKPPRGARRLCKK